MLDFVYSRMDLWFVNVVFMVCKLVCVVVMVKYVIVVGLLYDEMRIEKF